MMKSVCVVILIAALSSLGATAWMPNATSQDADSVQWTQLLEYDMSPWIDEVARSAARPGANAIGFRVNDAIQGGALITVLQGPVIGVFVGLNVPGEFINETFADLRVVFTLADGSVRTVAPAAGAGAALLFQSPDDLPLAEIRKVALFADETAHWVRSP